MSNKLFKFIAQVRNNMPVFKGRSFNFTTFLLRRHKHTERRRVRWYTKHELWDMGFHDGIWHSKPDPEFTIFPQYMSGWKYSKDK